MRNYLEFEKEIKSLEEHSWRINESQGPALTKIWVSNELFWNFNILEQNKGVWAKDHIFGKDAFSLLSSDTPGCSRVCRVVIEVSDQLGRDLEHIFVRANLLGRKGKSIQKAYKCIQNAYKCIQKHTNAYKTVSSDQLDQGRANPALSQPW